MQYTATIPDDHPALPGHFPGNPVVPGVIILDHVLRAAGSACALSGVKFTSPLRPEERFTVEMTTGRRNRLQFTVRANGRTIVTGSLQPDKGIPL